jgi:putative zinc finger/helix-turn-helix YgiT family protein
MEKFGYKCPECGKGVVKGGAFTNYNVKINNYPFVIPTAIIGVCDSCGAKNFDPQERERWADLYKTELEKNRILLGSKEIKKIRKDLGLSMEDFARLIGCTRQSIYNWEKISRKVPQSKMADFLIRLINESIYKGKINVTEFLLAELKKLKVEIKLKEDMLTILTDKEYRAIPHPSKDYKRNFDHSEEPSEGFSPRLKL